MVRTIYTDNETENIIIKIKEIEPDFNLSSFIKESILNYSQAGSVLNEDMITKNTIEAKNQLESAKNNMEYWIKKREDFEVHKKIMQEKEKEELEKEREKMNKEQERMDNIKSTFLEIMGRKMTQFEYDEYNKSSKNIWGFCEELK